MSGSVSALWRWTERSGQESGCGGGGGGGGGAESAGVVVVVVLARVVVAEQSKSAKRVEGLAPLAREQSVRAGAATFTQLAGQIESPRVRAEQQQDTAGVSVSHSTERDLCDVSLGRNGRVGSGRVPFATNVVPQSGSDSRTAEISLLRMTRILSKIQIAKILALEFEIFSSPNAFLLRECRS